MDNKFSIRQFPSPEHLYIAFTQQKLAILDISRFTFCKVDYIQRNNLQLEYIRYSKTMLTLFMFNFTKQRIRHRKHSKKFRTKNTSAPFLAV